MINTHVIRYLPASILAFINVFTILYIVYRNPNPLIFCMLVASEPTQSFTEGFRLVSVHKNSRERSLKIAINVTVTVDFLDSPSQPASTDVLSRVKRYVICLYPSYSWSILMLYYLDHRSYDLGLSPPTRDVGLCSIFPRGSL
jgi:hypothetical protein